MIKLSALVGLLVLGGCSISTPSEESHYYLLSSPELVQQHQETFESGASVIAVGPIRFSDYLKRSSLVLKTSGHEYEITKLDQWGGSLENEFEVALLKNLLTLNPGRQFVLESGMLSRHSSLNLNVDVYRFDATPASDARLEASWAWINNNGEMQASGTVSESVPAGATIDQQVSAMSLLVKKFAEKVSLSLP